MMIEALLFYFLAFVAAAAGVAILLSRNIVRIAYWLIGMLVSVAGMYFLLGAYFLGAVQLIVYVGGVAVLVVFGVMLSSRRLSERMIGGGWELLWASGVALLVLAGLVVAFVSTSWPENGEPVHYPVNELGQSLLGDFLGPFELASILLLIVLLGAGYLARPRVPRPGTPTSEEAQDEY